MTRTLDEWCRQIFNLSRDELSAAGRLRDLFRIMDAWQADGGPADLAKYKEMANGD